MVSFPYLAFFVFRSFTVLHEVLESEKQEILKQID